MQALKEAAEQCAAEFLEAFQRIDGELGTESKSEFHGIDAFVNRLNRFKAAFDNLVRQTEVTTIRQRNALLPIQKLPEELLRLIFHITLLVSADRRRSHYVRRISALRAVSWAWRGLIDRTPLFWTHISSNDHPDFVSNALERSLNLPLYLKHTVPTAPARRPAFFDKVSAHQNRWKYVVLHEPTAELLQTYFHVPNPSITGLLLSTDTGYASGEASLNKLLGGEIANLEELRAVRWKNIVWSEVHFRQLRVLEIEDYHMLGMGVIFDILAENPCLEIFRLHSIVFARYTLPSPTPPPINLDRLVELKLVNIEQVVETETGGKDAAITRLLRRIRIPACSNFEMDSWLKDGPGISSEELVDLIPPPMQVIARGRLETSDTRPVVVDACFGEGNFQFKAVRGSRSRPSFAIKLGALPRSIAKKWITEQMEEESAQTLDLRLRFEYPEGELSLDDISYFQRWESVTSLDINGRSLPPYPSSREFLWHLSTPFVSETRGETMPFPRLKNLRLFDLPFKGKDLVNSITLRFGSDAPAPEELAIILADGLAGRPEWYIDSIKTIPGVKDVRLSDDLDEMCSVSSVSDWPPHERSISSSCSTESCEG
ncbi:hypothetical protein M407DRAFT_212546 [Tulasnella calospora MUT 4182]|uniref:Uncharacterized protein n=1 Tax=Tulasnella calospora MUT 4182 TaxID=1051891 RepID=A0A0C3Q5S1_9AGAM|nr:hypothetical protein M407DRAFT_212546 [Tulasnella calospora MUT 4182]